MPDVLTFGEIMLRLTTPNFQRFAQAAHFDITFGGAEANVAAAIAQMGGNAGFLTKLPDNEIADRALRELRGLGVDVSRVIRGGSRIGVYFLEQGAGPRAGKVVYDRAHSSLAEAAPTDFDWDRLLAGAKWFHWTGITAALSDSAAAIANDACVAARRAGLAVSFEVNHRAKLWSLRRAGAVLGPMMEHVNVCVTSVEEACAIFEIDAPAGLANRETLVAQRLCHCFGFSTVALTMRTASSAASTNWGAMLFTGNKAYFSKVHELAIVDRIGTGDSFTAGLIFALRRGDDPQQALDFAVAASCLKHSIPGDYNLVSLAEIEALVAGGNGGRVQR
jgi:2-dehydro-3-deoxygluconokinase